MKLQKFTKTELFQMLDADVHVGQVNSDLRVVERTPMESGDWDLHTRYVFEDTRTDKFYTVVLTCGATEYQDYEPRWTGAGSVEWDDPEHGEVALCAEVTAVEVTVTQYKEVE